MTGPSATLPFVTPFLLQYQPEPGGFVMASRTHLGIVEIAGGRLNYLSGDSHFHVLRYATRDGMSEAVERQYQALAKPQQLRAAGQVPFADAQEALTFLHAIAVVCSTNGRRTAVPAHWRSAAEPLLNAILPDLSHVQVVRDDESPDPSRYDW